MKKYKLLVTLIIAIGVILIGTSSPVSNLYKTTTFINRYKLDEKDKSQPKDSKAQNEKFTICIDP
ncbi:MAG: N-acetylmuramoyl-L-alanine amidase, partial [Paraclostridium sp.]